MAGDPGAWPRLEPALTRPIRWDLIAAQYDSMIKYATAIRTGTASTEAILRRFTKANAVHPAYQAMAEVGRAQRTIFLARFLPGALFLFESSWKKPYSDRGVRKILARYTHVAGITASISPHTLRHFLFRATGCGHL